MKHKKINLLFMTLVVGLLIAGLVLGMAGPVAAQSTNFQLIAFGVKTNPAGTLVTDIGWGRGNSDKGWREGDWVPVKLLITNVQTNYPGLSGFPDLYLGFDFTSNSGSRFVDLVRDIQVGTVDLTDAQGWPQSDGTPYDTGTGIAPWPDLADVHIAQTSPGQNIWTGYTDLQGVTLVNYPEGATDSSLGTLPGTVTDKKHQFMIDADDIIAAVPSGANTIIVYCQAHLSRTFVWTRSLQSLYNAAPYDEWGGDLYGDPIYATDTRIGSSGAPGSSGHMYVLMTGLGMITCQLPIPPAPAGLIDGNKFEDLDNDGEPREGGEPGIEGWRIYIAGEDPDGLLLTDSVLTDATGFYSFPNLTPGTWWIAEDVEREVPAETFWSQTYPNGGSLLVPPVAMPIPTNTIPFVFPGSPDLADWGYNVTLTDTNIVQHNVDFGNVGAGCLEITKALNIPAGVPLPPLDGTFVIHVAGPNSFSDDLTFTMTDGAVSGPQTINNLTPGTYTLTEPTLPTTPAGWSNLSGLGDVEVSAGATCAARTVTNQYQPGCLTITKALNIPAGVPLPPLDGTFVIHVAGPNSFSDDLTFTMTDGAVSGPQTINNLIPGTYTLTEPTLPSTPPGWSNLSGLGDVVVSSSATCAARTVTNEFTPGCLEVTKVVDLDEYPFASSANATFNITLTGPSHPTGLDLTFELINGEVFYVDDAGTASACLCGLIPGNYTVSEIPPAGWNLTGITPPQPVEVEPGTACDDNAVEVTVTNRLLIPHTTMSEMTYDYDSASGNVTINITDCNDGEVPLIDAVVYLRANNVTYGFSPMGYSSPYFAGGDDNTNDVLDPGECWTWVVTVTINGTTFFEAWGDATDPLGNPVGYDPDTGEGLISEYQSFEIAACWGDETAWAYGGDNANALWDYVDSNNWGWTNNITEGSYLWPVYAGAGQNDISKGTLVGNVSVDYAGGCVNVTYSMNASYYLGETHLWVGNTPLPLVTKGKKTVPTNAPGQFPYGVDYGFNSTDPGTWETEWSWSGCGFSGEIYVAAHGVVWMEVECENDVMSSMTQTEPETQIQTASDDQTTYLWDFTRHHRRR